MITFRPPIGPHTRWHDTHSWPNEAFRTSGKQIIAFCFGHSELLFYHHTPLWYIRDCKAPMRVIENCCSSLHICLWIFKHTKSSALFFYILHLLYAVLLEMSDEPITIIYPCLRHNFHYTAWIVTLLINLYLNRDAFLQFLNMADDTYMATCLWM